MKKIIACLMACFAVFAFAACSLNKSGAPDSKGKEPLKIICTNFASYDFVRQIVGDKAEVTMLLKPGAEAHSYEPSPKDIQAIGKSDLFVYTGGDSGAVCRLPDRKCPWRSCDSGYHLRKHRNADRSSIYV